jgi:hypothetical protein
MVIDRCVVINGKNFQQLPHVEKAVDCLLLNVGQE